MKINHVEITPESFPILAFCDEASRTQLDWHIACVEAVAEKDEQTVFALGSFALRMVDRFFEENGERSATVSVAAAITKISAFRLIQFAAVAGHGPAVVSMADCYAKGIGTPPDLRRAAAVLEVAGKIRQNGDCTQLVEQVRDLIEETLDAVAMKALQRPVLQ